MSTIYKKLIAAKKAFPAIIKDTKAYGYQYAELSQVIEAISEPLWNAQLDFYQISKDGHMITGVVDVETAERLDLVDYEIMSVTMAKTNELQNFGGGLTYLRRYSLMQAFGLATEDNDGKTAKDPRAKPATAHRQPPLNQNELYTLLASKNHLLTHDQVVKTEAGIKSNDAATHTKIEQWLLGL